MLEKVLWILELYRNPKTDFANGSPETLSEAVEPVHLVVLTWTEYEWIVLLASYP